jgi:acetyl-CoA synthase
MSKIIASAAIRGAHKIVDQAEQKWREAMEKWGAQEPVGFPDTAYYLPVIYGITGMKVEKLGGMEAILKKCRGLLPPLMKEDDAALSLDLALDAGMATFWAEEITEAIRYLEQPDYYLRGEDVTGDNIWLGAADDIIMRRRGLEFVDGTAPGFATILGAAPTSEVAKNIAEELQKRNLYIFLIGQHNGTTFSEQLLQAGVQIGWGPRLVSFGSDVSATAFAIGFATRAAMSFGGIEAGDYKRILAYNRERVFAFVITLGTVTEEWCANGVGAVNWGFPIIADTSVPEIPPAGGLVYSLVVPDVPHDKIVAKAIDVRGLKVVINEVPIPVAFGAAFEGERVRGDDIYLEGGGGRTHMVEWVTSRPMEEVEDGKVEIIGPELTDVAPGSRLPIAIKVEVAGRQMQEDYEPILERQIHHLINYAQGVMHIGQRDIAWLRVSKQAVEKGFKLEHIGKLLHAKLHQDFGRIFDKLQVKIYTRDEDVDVILEKAREVYRNRDARIEGMTDEVTDTYYSCTLCQSFAPSHVCVISPERTGLCGAYSWMDCKAAYEINPNGPNQPVVKGEIIDARLGQWRGVNEFVTKASRGQIDHYNFYSIMHDPMTTCGCCEAIAAVLPMCNGIMTVNRDYVGDTPCGMKFSTLAGTIGGGLSTPGFMGHGKYSITQRKFVVAEGGLLRMVWMPKMLKDEIGERIKVRAKELGVPDLLEKIADETVGVTEDDILPFLQEKGHPALTMDPILD